MPITVWAEPNDPFHDEGAPYLIDLSDQMSVGSESFMEISSSLLNFRLNHNAMNAATICPITVATAALASTNN